MPAGGDAWAPPLNIAHRGASARAPENTLAAFERAIADGASAVEMDLRATADGRVVVIHDRTVDRTTDGSGPVAAMDYGWVRRLDAGSWFAPEFAGERVPGLEDVIERILPRIPCVLHVKAPEAAARLPDLLPQESRPRVTVSCSRLDVLRRLSDSGVIRTWVTWWRYWPGWTRWIIRRALRVGVDRVAAQGATVTRGMVEEAHRAGLQIRAWGVDNDLDLAKRLLKAGVDGLTFDDPARLAPLIEDLSSPSKP